MRRVRILGMPGWDYSQPTYVPFILDANQAIPEGYEELEIAPARPETDRQGRVLAPRPDEDDVGDPGAGLDCNGGSGEPRPPDSSFEVTSPAKMGLLSEETEPVIEGCWHPSWVAFNGAATPFRHCPDCGEKMP